MKITYYWGKFLLQYNHEKVAFMHKHFKQQRFTQVIYLHKR